MKVGTIKYGNVLIRWQYDDKNNPLVTKAFLERKIGENEKEVIKEVTVKRYHKDSCSKGVARKAALAKLVKESFTKELNDMQDRVAIWDAYNKR